MGLGKTTSIKVIVENIVFSYEKKFIFVSPDVFHFYWANTKADQRFLQSEKNGL